MSDRLGLWLLYDACRFVYITYRLCLRDCWWITQVQRWSQLDWDIVNQLRPLWLERHRFSDICISAMRDAAMSRPINRYFNASGWLVIVLQYIDRQSKSYSGFWSMTYSDSLIMRILNFVTLGSRHECSVL